MLGEHRSLELLESALAAADADQAEAFIYRTTGSLTRFAESTIHQNVAEENAVVSVRAVLGKRIGCARGNQPTRDEVGAVARRAHDLAQVAAEDPAFVSLPGPQPILAVPAFAEATACSTPEQRADIARTIVGAASAAGCRASGSVSVESVEIAVANSLGVRAYAPVTSASVVLVVADAEVGQVRDLPEPVGEASGYADWRGLDISQLDPRALSETATRKCVEGRGAQPVDPGEYTVILEPAAVGDLLGFLGYLGFGALSLQEGRSFLTDRIGQQVMGANINIWDDPADPRGLPMPFDWEGVPAQRVTLIENGVALGVAYDSYTAAKDGRQSTGHALPAPSTYGPMPTHLFLGSGDASLADMIASTDRGILVTRFHYTNVIHEKQTIITGMTRDGTFLIESGKIVRPVKNLRFTQSVVEALSNVSMVGKEGRLAENAFVPALKIERFSFTS